MAVALPPRGHSATAGERSAPASSWWAIPLAAVIALAAVAAYRNSFAGPFIFDDHLWIVRQPEHSASLADRQVLFPANALRRRPARGQPDAGHQLCPGRDERLGLSRREPGHHILAAWTLFGVVRRTLLLPPVARTVRPGATPLALVAGPALDGPPPANRGGDLRHPAHRGPGGAVLSAGALLRHSRGNFSRSPCLVRCGRRRRACWAWPPRK